MDALFAAEAAGADEQEAIGETEDGPGFPLRSGPKYGCVDAVRDDVGTRRIEAVRTAGVGNLLMGRHDRLAIPEDSPVSLSEMASRERNEVSLLAEHVKRSAGTELTLHARPDEADEVAVKHHDQRGRPLRAAPCELERARAFAVNDVKRLLGVDPNECLIGALPPPAAREIVRRSLDVVSTDAVDLLLAKPFWVPGRYQLNFVTSRNETECQVGRMVLHAADPVEWHEARDDADSHAETVEEAEGKACCPLEVVMSALVEKATRTLREDGFAQLVFKTLRYPLKPLLVPRASRALQAVAAERPGIEEWVQLVQRFNYSGITIESWQIPSEITGFLRILRAEPPQTVLEIGTAKGGTLFLLTRVAAPEALLISVDLRRGQFGGGYPAWRAPLYRSFARAAQRVQLVAGDSHEPRTAQQIRRLLEDRTLDLLFVDGDHTYEGVKHDFANYAQLVRPGGVVAFHDIVPGGPGKHGDPGGVPTFWQELKAEHAGAMELVEDWEWGSCGIGVIRLPSASA
jgi:cephalosporin hydroxylase